VVISPQRLVAFDQGTPPYEIPGAKFVLFYSENCALLAGGPRWTLAVSSE